MFKKRRAPDPRVEEGLAEIAAWEQWFRAAHEKRLLYEFPDTHLLEQERARIEAQATAIVARMREQYLSNARRQS